MQNKPKEEDVFSDDDPKIAMIAIFEMICNKF